MITKLFHFAVSILLLTPRIYVGLKGLSAAKKVTASKRHVIWALIIFAVALLNLVSLIADIVMRGGVGDRMPMLLGVLLEVLVYFDYIRYAKMVSRES